MSLLSLIKPNTYSSVKYSKKNIIRDLNRIVDFAVFTRNYDLILLIEIGDSSHKKRERVIRDIYLRKICHDTNIKLIIYNPLKFINDFEIKDDLKNEIMCYYDSDRDNIVFETL